MSLIEGDAFITLHHEGRAHYSDGCDYGHHEH